MSQNKLILSIESGIGGGSLALFNAGKLIGSRSGTAGVSRSEDLLSGIAVFLEDHEIKSDELDIIAIANDCGSRTGLRIGISTVMGLSSAIGCEITGISLLNAMADHAIGEQNFVCAAASTDRHVYFKFFDPNTTPENEKPQVADLDGFRDQLTRTRPKLGIFNQFLDSRFDYPDMTVKNVGEKLAEVVGNSLISRSADVVSRDILQFI